MIDIKRLIFDKSLNQRLLAQILGCQQSEVSLFANRKRNLSDKQYAALVAHFGKDVVDSYTIPETPILGIPAQTEVTILDPEVVDEIRKEIREEIEEVDAFPVLPEDIATKPNTDVREYITDNSGELEHINPSQMLRQADMAERVLRTSMMPTFQPEDIVFVRFIQDKMKIVDGDIYYIDSKSRPTMIRQIKFTEDGKLRLIAQNPQYGDIVIDRAEVNNIATIVGLLRMNFSDQYSQIENIRRAKENEREKKDSQIDKLLEQQSKLIDHIVSKR